MAEKVEKWYPGTPREKVSIGRMVLLVLATLAIISALIRLFLGLGATTNLNDAYPWGLWISFDVLAGVALAGGGFTMAAIIYVFNLKKFEPLLRPAKISAFIGYLDVYRRPVSGSGPALAHLASHGHVESSLRAF